MANTRSPAAVGRLENVDAILPLTASEPGYWECDLGDTWAPYEWPTSSIIELAFCNRRPHVEYSARGHNYRVTFLSAAKTGQDRIFSAIQMNERTFARRKLRRWPSQAFKLSYEEMSRQAISRHLAEWSAADWTWTLLDQNEIAAVSKGSALMSPPAKAPYKVSILGDLAATDVPDLLHTWPLEDAVCAEHPLGVRCNFALRRLLPHHSLSGGIYEREWAELEKIWNSSNPGAWHKLVGAYRIQNKAQFQSFVGVSQAMRSRLSGEGFADGVGREGLLQVRMLWHGTRAVSSLLGICCDGFDRAHANVCAYGKGCYFSTSQTYSDKYACDVRPLDNTSRTLRALLLAAVLVGEGTQGSLNMYPPPIKPHSRSGERYENTYDKVNDPTIIVTYKDFQSVPAYVVIYERTKGSN